MKDLNYDCQVHILKQFDWFSVEDNKKVRELLNIIIHMNFPGDISEQKTQTLLFYEDWSNYTKTKYDIYKWNDSIDIINDEYTYEIYGVSEKGTSNVTLNKAEISSVIRKITSISMIKRHPSCFDKIINNGFIWRQMDTPAIVIKDNSNNKNILEVYFTDKNTYVVHIECGNFKIISYYKNGILHRTNGPAQYYYHINMNVEVYYRNGKIHRKNGPAIIKYFNILNIVKEEHYYINGLHHRINEPAVILYYAHPNKVKEERYYINGLLHRENDKPAEIKYAPNGKIIKECWMLNDRLRRKNNNPVIVEYDEHGKIKNEGYEAEPNMCDSRKNFVVFSTYYKCSIYYKYF